MVEWQIYILYIAIMSERKCKPMFFFLFLSLRFVHSNIIAQASTATNFRTSMSWRPFIRPVDSIGSRKPKCGRVCVCVSICTLSLTYQQASSRSNNIDEVNWTIFVCVKSFYFHFASTNKVGTLLCMLVIKSWDFRFSRSVAQENFFSVNFVCR